MVVALSRFKVANGMEADVARAFRERPGTVEQAPGFLWLEVFADAGDPSVFYLVTRWTDREAFETWHKSPAHRDSHAFIPKGLKLDPEWTQVLYLERIDGVTGPPITEAIIDAPLLLGAFAAASTEIAIVVLGRDGVVRTCNPIACDQFAAGAALNGESVFAYMPKPDGKKLRDLLAAGGRTTEPVRLNFAAPNRTPLTLDCWLDVQGDRAILVAHPPSRRDRQMQDELMAINQELAVLSRERSREVRDERVGRHAAEKLNRDRNAFLTVLAHELRQPIGGALAAMGVMRRLNPDPSLERSRALLERQLLQITRLVEDLADTARVASGDVELRRSRVDLVHVLRDLAPAWESAAEPQGHTFVSELPDGPLVISGDVNRLQQVFSNLVTNAFKYTPPGGTVTLTVAAEGASVMIVIRDEGEGIPADRLPHIFDLFHRATTTGSGLGVGLAVVSALVRAHGGTIEAASAGVGRGTTFTVRLPLA